MNYGKGDYANLRNSLDIDWVQLFGNCDNDVNRIWDCFKNTLLSNIQIFIPSVSDFGKWKKPSWKCPLDENVRKLIRKKIKIIQRIH